ncbi:hypothetical protein HDU98_003826 [Podochytrium sp. JEL0797]|nr:hypothetical protein HDU98_003826 [Podochytrium sp. JEL0797]
MKSTTPATQLFLSKGAKSSKATFHLNGILFMLSPIEDASDSTDLQLLLSAGRVPTEGGVQAQMDMWAALVADSVDDAQLFDSHAFVEECVAAGLVAALGVAKVKVGGLWTRCKGSAAFGRVALRLQHKFTTQELHSVGDAAIAAFFSGRWVDVSPVGASLLITMFDLLGTDNGYLRLAAEAAEVVGEVLELINQQPLRVDNPPQLAHRLKRTAAFFPAA